MEIKIQVKQKPNTEDLLQKVINNDGYCPCSLIKNKTTKCICENFRYMISNRLLGECDCGLYETIKVE